MAFGIEQVASQEAALRRMAEVVATDLERPGSGPKIVQVARAIVSDCDARDDRCEVEAVFEAVKNGTDKIPGLERGVRYVSDPRTFDYFSSASKTLRACRDGACGGDCLPYDTLVLRRDYRLVPLEDVRIGDVIMGDGRWTTVLNRWDKGEKDLIAIRLNNGSTLRVTADHRLFRVPKVSAQGTRTPSAQESGPRESAEEVRAGDLRVGDDLLTVESIPVGCESIDADEAWLLGAYIADGWSDGQDKDHPTRICISGRDGKPKEEQKRRVQKIAEARGWPTRWHERYIAINDGQVAQRFAACGRRAPQKHIPSGLNYDEATIRAILSGLLADAHVRADDGCTTHGTTSRLLAAQLRVMYRMLGQSTSLRRVDAHGGLGANPIYRVTPRMPVRANGNVAKQHARVKSITEIGAEPVMDIETDSRCFYLPETDLVVHNCDDQAILLATLLSALGFKVGLRAWGPKKGKREYVHVYAVVALPKHGPWPAGYSGHGLDTTVPESSVGWEPRKSEVLTVWIEGN